MQVDLEEVVNKVEKRSNELVAFIEEGLRDRVYTKADENLVENSRRLLDLRGLALKVKEHGSVHITSLQYKPFHEAAVFFEPEIELRLASLKSVSKGHTNFEGNFLSEYCAGRLAPDIMYRALFAPYFPRKCPLF